MKEIIKTAWKKERKKERMIEKAQKIDDWKKVLKKERQNRRKENNKKERKKYK